MSALVSCCPLQVKLDVYLAELTKIGKSQKYTLSVDVEGGRLVVMKKMKDNQEDWTTFTHDKSENNTYTKAIMLHVTSTPQSGIHLHPKPSVAAPVAPCKLCVGQLWGYDQAQD